MRPLWSTFSRSLPPASVTSWERWRTSSPLGLLLIGGSVPGPVPAPSSGVVGELEAGEVGHRPDAVQVDLEELAEAARARAERRAGGGVEDVAEQQVAAPAGEPEVDRAGGGDAALLGDRRQAGEHPALGVLGDPGHGPGSTEAGVVALGTGDAWAGAAGPGLGDVQGAVGTEPDPAGLSKPSATTVSPPDLLLGAAAVAAPPRAVTAASRIWVAPGP
jgi:hypothetical protein